MKDATLRTLDDASGYIMLGGLIGFVVALVLVACLGHGDEILNQLNGWSLTVIIPAAIALGALTFGCIVQSVEKRRTDAFHAFENGKR